MAGRDRAARKRATAQAAPAAVGQRPGVVGLLPVAAAALAHANGLGGAFVYDDFPAVVDNPSLRSLASLDVLRYAPFRPVVNVSYALDAAVWGRAPFGFHLTSLLLHLCCVALLFALARRVAQDAGRVPREAQGLALASALVFAVHPLFTEAVGYVSARSELLCGAFCLASFLALRQGLLTRRPLPLALGAALWLVALASKETAVGLPVLLWLYDRLLLPAGAPERRFRLTRVHLPLLALLVAGAGARLWVFATAEAGRAAPSGYNLVQQSGVMFRYLGLFLVPLGQSLVHSVEEVRGLGSPSTLALLALVAAGGLAFWKRRALALEVWGAAWFVVMLLPSSSVVVLAEPMAEHRAYVASFGLALALLALAQRALGRWVADAEVRRRAGLAALAVVVLALAGATFRRDRVWASELSLWEDAARKSPRVWAARYAHADALRAAGRCAEAVPEYQAAISLVPDERRAHSNLGICLAGLRRYPEAQQALERAAALAPGDPAGQRNLGRLAEAMGEPGRAAAHFARAAELEARPRD